MSNLLGKMVIYNGGRDSYSGCDSPNNLVIGKAYRVIDQDVKGFQTDLYLSGVSGKFNSVWFNEAKTETQEPEVEAKKVWHATAVTYCLPSNLIGKRISLKRWREDKQIFEQVTTSIVRDVKKICEGAYLIETDNSMYITKMKIRTGN